MSGTLSTCRDAATKSADEAIKLLYSKTERASVIMYNTSKQKLYDEVDKVYQEIKRRNVQISDLQKQMLPSQPYDWEDIDGCSHVWCVEISMNTFEHNAKNIALFTGWNYDVLTNPDARAALSSNTMLVWP